ncbi:mitochondrial carrier domain-containing protein [Fomitopsis serialis]|uniref:mitochondrial carrier domain-containing protein n=1 Tax=Fomitopsis serialis TaxID=139415 RepID=UPI002007E318|nr:mitochondrial carrier domain-containing protein [Neoantrodia serialis]KAH9915881.1 mitochondrial carrier domain-containing protein [Neoantrodia serialis]
MTSALPPLVQACSGALASASANAISYPLDLVATRAQTTRYPRLKDLRGALRILRHIVNTQGLSGLYDGLATDTASTVLSNFLYFYFYTVLHALVARRRASRDSSVPLLATLKKAITSPTAPVLLGVPTELAVGWIAGIASRVVSTPLSVLTVRLQSSADDEDDSEEQPADSKEKKRAGRLSLCDVARGIYAEQGVSGFWAGFAPTLPLCLTPALTLLLFQLLRRIRLPYTSSSATTQSLRAFLDGACANALALAALYPLVLAKVRVQAWRKRSGAVDGESAPTMVDVWRTACAEPGRGWCGLYDGLGAQIVKGFVNQGVTMMVKQRIEHALVRMYLRRCQDSLH